MPASWPTGGSEQGAAKATGGRMGRGGGSGQGCGRNAAERRPWLRCCWGGPKLEGREVEEPRGLIGNHRPPCLEFVEKCGVREESQAGGRECRGDCIPLPPKPHSVPLSSWQQCPLPCCTQGHDCQHFYPPSDFTVSTQVFRDMKRSHSLHKVGEPWCLEVGLGAE